MSYRLYICKGKKMSNQEIDKKIEILNDMFKENPDDLTSFDIVKHLGFQNEMCLGGDDDAEKIRQQGESYFSQEQCFVINIPYDDEEDIDGNRIVKLTKEMILLYLDGIYKSMYKYYTDMLKDFEDECGPIFAQEYFHRKANLWKQDDSLNIDAFKSFSKRTNKEKLEIPYNISTSTEYAILQIIDLYNQTDWENEDVILYGF